MNVLNKIKSKPKPSALLENTFPNQTNQANNSQNLNIKQGIVNEDVSINNKYNEQRKYESESKEKEKERKSHKNVKKILDKVQLKDKEMKQKKQLSKTQVQEKFSIFQDIPPQPNSIKKIIDVTRNYVLKSYEQNTLLNENSKGRSLDSEKSNQLNSLNSYNQHNSMPIQPNQIPKQYRYLVMVKKGYTIGKMSILEGYLENRKADEELKVQILRTKQTKNIKISCKDELIQNPESISHIFMRKIIQIGDEEYLIGQKDIIKVIEKPSNRR